MKFDIASRKFVFTFLHDPDILSAPTLIFVPLFQYPDPPRIVLSDGSYKFQPLTQTMEYYHNASAGDVHTVTLLPAEVVQGGGKE